MNLLVAILVTHWIADFLCQSDYMATNKSTSYKALFLHGLIYSVWWLIPMTFFLGLTKALLFVAITFLIHTGTDYQTSRWTHVLYHSKQYRLFFNVIGLDQMLHYTQLFLTYAVLAWY